MRRSMRLVAVTAFLSVLHLSTFPGFAIAQKYIEDFTTTQYKDTQNTTAWWDTLAGELKLFPFVPTLAGSLDTPGYARGVAVSGDHAFVADGSSGLQVIDISDPTNPTLAGSYDTPGEAWGVAVSGDHAFVADGYSFQVIDIFDPTNPRLVGSCDTPGSAGGVAVSGDHAFVADGSSGFQVIDISDPTNPTLAGSYDTRHVAYGIAVSGDHAFVADLRSGLQMIDISDPTNPTLAGSYRTGSEAYAVAVSGDHAFVADLYSGLQVIRISLPVYPTLTGSYDTPGNARGVAVSGDHAFVADGYFGFQVIDISDPTNPTLAGSYDTPGYAWGVAVSGDHAFMADEISGFQVIDISDPNNPTLSGSCDTPGYALGVAVSGDNAFVADYSSGLQVIDISDPTNPTLAGSYDTPGYAEGIAVSGDHAFVADGSSGLQVIDISDPTNPMLAGTYDTPDYARGVAVSGDHAFVADGSSLQVIRISFPVYPMLAGSYDTPGYAWGVAVSGDNAFVADYSSGLQVIDISDPTNPTLSGSYDTPGYALGVAVSGDNAFVADWYSGLQVIQVFLSVVYSDNNEGWSLALDASNDMIVRARLTTVQADSVTWELSADGGMNWQGLVPDGRWNQMAVAGTDLMWRSTLSWIAPGDNPVVTGLQIDWLGETALIDSIIDVPDDQGRSVNLSFTRSGYDFLEETEFPIVGYEIYRRLDDPELAQQVMNQSAASLDEVLEHPQLASFSPDRVRMLSDRTFILDSAESTIGALPPGIWEVVGWILPTQSDSYTVQVNTLADSTVNGSGWTVFVTAAHTSSPAIWFVSEPDSGYSVDNIAPGVPLGLAVAYNTGSGNELTWNPSPETDFQYYRVYRGDSESFTPGPENLAAQTATPEWTDPEYDGWDVHYKITAFDHAGNESDAASAASTTGDDTPHAPDAFVLYQNVPNPFNPATTIRFDLPKAAHVKLSVFNVKGELVSTIADRQMSEGRKEFIWTAVDNRGRAVSSGIYFYRLVAADFVQTKKMVLLR